MPDPTKISEVELTAGALDATDVLVGNKLVDVDGTPTPKTHLFPYSLWKTITDGIAAGLATLGTTVTALSNRLINVPNVDATMRSNHTGTQSQSTIVGLIGALTGKSDVGHVHDDIYYRQTAVDVLLALKATLASPTFTGSPAAPTPTAGNNSTLIATTAYVTAAIQALIAGAPGALDTLLEISNQLANDENAVAALTTVVAGKVPSARKVCNKALTADITLAPADLTGVSANGAALITAADFAAMRLALNLVAGQNFNAYTVEVDKYAVQGADLVSATNMVLNSATGASVNITGNNTISSFGAAASGVYRMLHFTGSPVIVHNATSLITLAGASITTSAGDNMGVMSLGGGNWRILWHQRIESAKQGVQATTLTAAATTDIGAATGDVVYINGTTGITALGNAPLGARRLVVFNNTLTIANNSSIFFASGNSWTTVAGDTFEFLSIGAAQWRVLSIRRGAELERWLSATAGVSAATTVNIASNASWAISGNTQIEGFGSGTAGMLRYLTFNGTPTIYHSGNIRVPGASLLQVEAGDTCMVMNEGGTSWRIFNYQRASGRAVVEAAGTGATMIRGSAILQGYTDLGDPGSSATPGYSSQGFQGWTPDIFGYFRISNENGTITFFVQDTDPGDPDGYWIDSTTLADDVALKAAILNLVNTVYTFLTVSDDGTYYITFSSPSTGASSFINTEAAISGLSGSGIAYGIDGTDYRAPSGAVTTVDIVTAASGKSLMPMRIGGYTDFWTGNVSIVLIDHSTAQETILCNDITLPGGPWSFEVGNYNMGTPVSGHIANNFYGWVGTPSYRWSIVARYGDDPASNAGAMITLWAQAWQFTP